ncbi:MAG: hypothetical protein JNL83_34165 [Myxococcales bacterium]|nr:hypothetical protein [Myxococcales bacterium]
MKHWGVGLALLLSACTINGKKVGPSFSSDSSSSSSSSGGNSSGSSGSSGSSSSSGGGGGGESGSRDFYANSSQYPTAPADPWAAVNGDQPRRRSAEQVEHWKLRGKPETVCSAKIDHCIPADAWFIVKDSDAKRYMPTSAGWTVFDHEGHLATAWNGRSPISTNRDNKEITAYRTVPATRANIKPGSQVMVMSRDTGIPNSEETSYGAFWNYGIVDEVDVDGGFFTLKNKDDTFKLFAARVVVLSWKPGGKVEIVGGKGKNELAVKASDVFNPE